MSKTLCIYHGNCADGFGAAWAVKKAHPDWEFHAGVYGTEPPNVQGRDVVLVDFSYKRPVLIGMAHAANTILIIDHHKTAKEDLEGFSPPPTDYYNTRDWATHASMEAMHPIFVIFDMDRSGAMMAWDYFHPGEQPPALIEHIQDRDLWRFKLDGTREIQAAVFSYPYEFHVWDTLMDMPTGLLKADGIAIERKHFKDIEELLPITTRRMVIAGHNVPVANLPYIHSSDAGHKMAIGEPFAACYMDGPDGRTFSLRSSDEGEDVSAIASQYGGGGHKQAAGFMIGYDEAAKFELP